MKHHTFCSALFCIAIVAAAWSATPSTAAENPFGENVKTVLFLGDSNTYSGHYITVLEAQLRAEGYENLPTIINLGLSSETTSGLTEPGHPFPRPCVHERLDRALKKIQPDLVIACYGINDGVYAPLSEERFAAYRDGISRLVEKVTASGATCVLCTPSTFDPLPMKKKGKLMAAEADVFSWQGIYEKYDDVMQQYSEWLQQEFGSKLRVVDVHAALTAYVDSKRKTDPDFAMSGDGVHYNQEGHEVVAHAILDAFSIPHETTPDAELTQNVGKRQRLLRDAWLSEVGHLRPGVKPGLPIAEAIEMASKLP
ncbi:SGNH/GDSL hydrolase family protein [Stieleria varia]|uniref:GDSL-like Lipase/Acylhydrolase n=1 Tax=Stieleria varia TaxID=2528005 RepID=A0A5C6A5H5_9BACT|nr:SGNH/GDSL hydrolase family protein [Stieleria varia]TWT94645.1 GDSL-like Lipase/Acylhydrolase [Stieleria varia]